MKPSSYLASLLSALFLLTGCVGQADAGTLVNLTVTDQTSGEQLPVYRHRGNLYIAGTPGHRYAISLHNKSSRRVLTVVSVDGLNVLNGKTAGAAQSGYVMGPWQSAEIAGWRKSLEDVAAFYFTSVADSYAGRTERPRNVGVIGVAVFEEDVPPQEIRQESREAEGFDATDRPRASAVAPSSAPQARSKAPDREAASNLGTGHGERINAPSQYTEFRRASATPAEVLSLYYNSRANLIAQGVIPAKHQPGNRPDPFPGGFTPDPR